MDLALFYFLTLEHFWKLNNTQAEMLTIVTGLNFPFQDFSVSVPDFK